MVLISGSCLTCQNWRIHLLYQRTFFLVVGETCHAPIDARFVRAQPARTEASLVLAGIHPKHMDWQHGRKNTMDSEFHAWNKVCRIPSRRQLAYWSLAWQPVKRYLKFNLLLIVCSTVCMWTKRTTSSSWLFPSSMNSGDWTQFQTCAASTSTC